MPYSSAHALEHLTSIWLKQKSMSSFLDTEFQMALEWLTMPHSSITLTLFLLIP